MKTWLFRQGIIRCPTPDYKIYRTVDTRCRQGNSLIIVVAYNNRFEMAKMIGNIF